MQIEVTKNNIKMVKGIIEKLSKNKSMLCQSFYPSDKKLRHFRENLGISQKTITHSVVDTFSEVVVEVDVDLDGNNPYLRVHNNGETGLLDQFEESYLAFLIRVGDKITLKNNVIKIKKEHPVRRRGKCIETLKFK